MTEREVVWSGGFLDIADAQTEEEFGECFGDPGALEDLYSYFISYLT